MSFNNLNHSVNKKFDKKIAEALENFLYDM